MEQKQNDFNRYGGKGMPRMWSGFLLIIAGSLLLAYKMGAPIPHWVFTWPVLLIAIGLLMGLKSRFHNPGAFIMIVVGGVFLIDQTNPELDFHNYILPAILIAVGFIYVLKPKNSFTRMPGGKFRNMPYDDVSMANQIQTESNYIKGNKVSDENGEYLEINAVLGGVKKIIVSKNFKGGEINCFMGGAEINLLKADIQQQIVLEVNNVFGGTKLVVPSDWNVMNNVTAVLGGIEDKRSINTVMSDPDKTMILKGACVFGGIEISNY